MKVKVHFFDKRGNYLGLEKMDEPIRPRLAVPELSVVLPSASEEISKLTCMRYRVFEAVPIMRSADGLRFFLYVEMLKSVAGL